MLSNLVHVVAKNIVTVQPSLTLGCAHIFIHSFIHSSSSIMGIWSQSFHFQKREHFINALVPCIQCLTTILTKILCNDVNKFKGGTSVVVNNIVHRVKVS